MRSLPLVSRYLPSVSSLKRNLLVLASTSLVALPVFATNPSSISLAVASPSVSSGTAIVLTATVQGNGAPVSPGQVSFCDASALTCTGTGLLGTAQLNPAGTAALPILLGIGDHSIKAVFLGTNGTAPSISASVAVSVTGHAPTLTAISSSGTPGSYTLQTIVGYNGTALPGTSETVTFTDTTNANNPIGKAPLTGLTAPVYTFAKVPGAPVATGSLPTRVVTADVTGDGIPDQITANLADGTVSILRGKGDGTFAPISGSPYTVGTAPQAIAVADFNSDGLLDIAVANAGSANVTLLLGNTSGTFTQGATLAAGTGPQSIAAADYNHDGIPDLAVANLLSSNITVLLGDGTGHFTLASGSPTATGANPNWVAQADLNGDGYPDLAFVNTSDNTVGVLLGAGDGTFTAMTGSPFSVPAYPVALTVADLNGDGKLDLAVISGTQNNVRVLLNSGTSFTTGATYTAGASPNSIGVGDFNGDGKPDLVTANANDGTATVLLGAGDGTFSAAPDSPLQTFDGPLGVAVADLDGDGRADLTFADAGTSSVAALTQQVLQTAAATLSPVSIPGGGTHQILAAYSGDSSYSASNSSLIPLTGSLIPTSASLFVSPGATVSYMQPLQLTVSVVPPTNSNYQATGTGAFTDGGAPLGAATLNNGQALLSLATLSVGSHSLAARYSGDANFSASNASATTIVVQRAGTSTILTSSAASLTPGNSVTLTATTAALTSGVPTGTLSFFDNAGSVSLGQSPLVNGVATLTLSSLVAGSHSIVAVYNGDANYAGSSSAAVPEAVSDFAVSSSAPSQTVIPGHSVGIPLTITPSGNFTSAITLSATGLPPGATVAFSPATITPGSSASQVTMTVSTSLQTAAAGPMPSRSANPPLLFAFGIVLLPLMAARARRLRGRLRHGALLAILGFVGVLTSTALTGCSSAKGFLEQSPKTYNIIVTAAGGSVTHTTTVTLNVQ
jgi:hypothetical protein